MENMKQGMGPGNAPEAAPQDPQGADAGGPVQDALKVLAEFVMAQKQKGNPQAEAMITSLKEFVSIVSGKGEGEVEGGEPQPAMPQGRGPVSMEGGVNGKPVM